jgi:ABC-type arginine/histidine transport system permease subunit
MVAGAVVAAFVATLVAVVAHDPTAPPRARDAIASAWIGGLTACAYASLFFAGATVGVRGGGRWAALIFDFALGSTTGPFALLCPRAHAINLLGGEPVMMLSQTSSAGVLVLLSIGFGAIAIARTAP